MVRERCVVCPALLLLFYAKRTTACLSFLVVLLTTATHCHSTMLSLPPSLPLSPDANCIVEFGLNGNGLDRVVTYLWRRNLRVHCRAGTSDADIDWFFANGTKVGSSNQNLREGHYLNGTTVLQIASNRRLSLCDAGTYTCVTNCSGMTQSRNFTLVINCKY